MQILINCCRRRRQDKDASNSEVPDLPPFLGGTTDGNDNGDDTPMKKAAALTLPELYEYADQIGIDYTIRNMSRLEKAIDIANANLITPVPADCLLPGKRAFFVPSQSDDSTVYTVEIYDQYRSSCTCPDAHMHCKHALAVRIKELRDIEQSWEGFAMNDEKVTHLWLSLFGGAQ